MKIKSARIKGDGPAVGTIAAFALDKVLAKPDVAAAPAAITVPTPRVRIPLPATRIPAGKKVK